MAGVLYAALAGPNATSDLYTVDPVTAVMTSVGPIGNAVSGLAVDPTSGILYGSTSRNTGSDLTSLISIDTTTGAGTLIGGFGLGGATAHDIAFDSTGQLWGISSSADLWMIDKTTGAATSPGFLTPDRGGGALDFDGSDVLWQVANWDGNIDTVDTSDGTQTIVTATSDPGNNAHSGKFDGNGLFWASYPGGFGGTTNLVTIDTTTGVVTVIGAFSVPGVGGLAWKGSTRALTARFKGSPRFGYPGLTVTFTDQSLPGPSGPITGWLWDFGDGHTSTLQNPVHAYTSPGSYTVMLTVTGTAPDGTDTLTKTNYIKIFDPATLVLYAALAGGSHATSDLYTVDPVTAAMVAVGPIGFAVTGLAFDLTTNVLYGVTSRHSATDRGWLLTIDTTTGAGTPVARLHGGFGLLLTAHDIAFDGTGQLWGANSSGGQLWKIDKATAFVTNIGGGDSFAGGLDFDSIGDLWKVGDDNANIVTLDLTTGAPTLVSQTSDLNVLHSGKFDPATGDFYAGWKGETGAASDHLVSVDVLTGVVTTKGAFTFPGVGGIAWAPSSPPAPDFSFTLVPSTITVRDGVHTAILAETRAFLGDTESITLSASLAGFTFTFDTNPITAGNNSVVEIDVGAVALGTYTVTFNAVGTDNTHTAVLTIHVVALVPGTHIAS